MAIPLDLIITFQWIYTRYLDLDYDKLMRDRRNIRSVSRYQRLIELGEKSKVPVAKETLYLLLLAERMEAFLI
jgi:hypothetical protein